MEIVTDCLVLKIEERCTDKNELLTSVFIIYDKKEQNYVIRGKIADVNEKIGATFSFLSKEILSLEEFISFAICKRNKWTYVVYNYDNLPYNSNDITYDFLKQYESNSYEIAGYNNVKYNKKNLIRNLRMLSNVFNYYK